jgi:hypothetical protein
MEELLEQARKMDQAGNRKHHLIPKSYLSRWAIDDQIGVTETSTTNSYVTSPVRAAKETDFCRVDLPEIDPSVIRPRLLFEKALGEIEGHAPTSIRHLD